ncbi:hypothetical protein CDV31_009160 [Fusarium ambrosium]|uniref:Uncharacterized protein n=1 Tax=Fusarium ambrosium TaxID=131363 RepID=A0A428TWI8_9HYPO|nr:hypothetical protein CDV31_009160 [Fusarium ambrosium]
MYPVGETLTEDVVAMFLRVVLLRPLTMQSHGYIKSNPLLDHNVIFDTLSLMVEIPCQALEVEKMRNAGDWTALKDTILSKLSSSQGSAVPEGVVEDWNRSLAAFEDVQRFSKHIKPCFDDLSGQKYVSGGTFYTNLAQIRVAVSQFSVYQKCSQSIIEKLVKNHEKKAKDPRPVMVAGAAVLSFIPAIPYIYASTDPKTAIFLVGAFIGGVIKISEFFGGKKNINESLRNAQFALGILFCNQALGMPFPLLAKPKGVETLEGLGIDVTHIKGEEYSHKFALKSLKEFRRSYEDLEKVRDLVRKDAGIKEFLETTMASASPDGGEPMDCQED